MFTRTMHVFGVVLTAAFAFNGFAYSQACSPVPAGLVSWWQAENNALDSRSGNHGTLQNGATFTAGEVGRAFSFDGIDDFVRVPDNVNLSPEISEVPGAEGEITVSAWVNLAALPAIDPFTGQSSRTIVAKGGDGPGPQPEYEFELEIFTTGRVAIIAYGPQGGNSAFALGDSPVGFTLNQWHLITGTIRNRQFIRIYFDGALLTEGTVFSTSQALSNTASGLFIGARGDGKRLNGLVDEVQIYNRVLSTTEIQAIFNAGTAGNCKPIATLAPAGLISWWPGDGDPRDIQDGNSPTTAFGSPTFVAAKVAQGMKFDGGSGYRVSDNDNLDFNAAASFTLESWVRVDQVPANTSVFVEKRQQSGPSGYVLGVEGTSAGTNAGKLFVVIQSGGTSVSLDTTSAVDGAFHHLAAVIDRSNQTLSLYLDGVLQGIPSGIGGIGDLSNSGGFFIGINTQDLVGSTAVPFNGVVDELSAYGRALTRDEITSIFAAGTAGKLKPFAPTAADVSISGRVIDRGGRGVARVMLELADKAGNTLTARTNIFGYYAFDPVAAGQTYILTANAKNRRFTDNPRVVNALDDLTGTDFTESP